MVGGGGSGDEEEGRTEMIMARLGKLQGKEDNLVKDLKETTLSFKKLGRRYGVSRQAVHAFSKRQVIKRAVKPRGQETGGTGSSRGSPLCGRLLLSFPQPVQCCDG